MWKNFCVYEKRNGSTSMTKITQEKYLPKHRKENVHAKEADSSLPKGYNKPQCK